MIFNLSVMHSTPVNLFRSTMINEQTSAQGWTMECKIYNRQKLKRCALSVGFIKLYSIDRFLAKCRELNLNVNLNFGMDIYPS